MSDPSRQPGPRISPLLSVLKQRRPVPAGLAPCDPEEEDDPALPERRPRLREVRGSEVGPEAPSLLRVAEAPATMPASSPLPTLFGDAEARLEARRRARRRGRRGAIASFVVVVALPVLAALIYYLFLASDQYVSEVKFAVRAVERNTGHDAINVVNGPPNAVAGNTDSFILADYVTTRQFVDEVDRKLDLRKIFSDPAGDLWSRFDPAGPVEALVDHWRSVVVSRYDLSTGILTVKVRAFTAQDSFRLAEAVLEGSERLANEMTERGRRDFVRFAEAELVRAEARLQTARKALGDFRRQEGTFDPVRVATSNADLLAKLRSDLSSMQAEATALASALQPNAPVLQALTSRIKATERQLRLVEAEGRRDGGGEGTDMGSLVSRYAALEAEQGFAEKSYGVAVEALRSARSLADRQQVYLATFARPALAESARYPSRPAAIALVAGFALLAWMTGMLIVLGIRDHMR